jgi:GT2 family glycosyltransferase
VMFKKELYDQIGAFDEQFFNYCSDSDYLKRLELAGKKYKLLDQVATSHISDATGYSIAETPEIMNEDKAKYAEKWDNYSQEPITIVAEPKNYSLEELEEVKIEDHDKNKFIRTNETGDKIYYVSGNTVHWVKDPETFATLGGEFGSEVTITEEEFEKYTRGEPLDIQNVRRYA